MAIRHWKHFAAHVSQQNHDEDAICETNRRHKNSRLQHHRSIPPMYHIAHAIPSLTRCLPNMKGHGIRSRRPFNCVFPHRWNVTAKCQVTTLVHQSIIIRWASADTHFALSDCEPERRALRLSGIEQTDALHRCLWNSFSKSFRENTQIRIWCLERKIVCTP